MKNGINKPAYSTYNNWHLHQPPGRPSAETIALYEHTVSLKNQEEFAPAWGLLGCTPEIRSLSGKYQSRLVCIDNNQEAYHGLLPMCIPSKAEEFLLSNWLDLNINEAFDLVFGDLSINMLPLDKHDALLKIVSNMLKPNGLAVLRVFINGIPFFKDPAQIFEWYRNNRADAEICYVTKKHLIQLWLDPELLTMSRSQFKIKLQELLQDGIITTAEFNAFKYIEQSKFRFQYTSRELFECQASRHFNVKQVLAAGDYPNCENAPIYLLSNA